MLNLIVSFKMKSFIESENTKIFGNFYKNKKINVSFIITFHGVVVRELGCCTRGSWFESHLKWFESFFSVFFKMDSMNDFVLTLNF